MQKRMPLSQRTLPAYTEAEEHANMITHIVGAATATVITVICILTAILHRNVWGVVSAAIYGFTLIDLFTMSSIYHGMAKNTAKKVFQIIDHCTIYLLIAGSYTPVLLSAVRIRHPAVAWAVFGTVWGIAATAAVFTAIDLKKYRFFSMACYLGLGWCVLLILNETVEAITLPGFLWLLGGGICYTVGALLYAIGIKKRYFHTVFHLFVNLGSLQQAICMIKYVL